MSYKRISRRDFVALAAAGAAAGSLRPRDAAAAGITAQDIVDRIKKNVGVGWNADTVDTFKAGDPSTPVTGVVTTPLATLEVLRETVKRGANLVITCEPTFYANADVPTPPPARGSSAPMADRVFAAKDEFIRTHNLVVWRFSDHWRLRTPDPFVQGLMNVLGWSRVTIPSTDLRTLVSHIKTKLNASGGIRVVGDPRTRVQKVALLPGTTPIQAALRALPQADVIVAGEVREWESAEYARDVIDAGGRKALILIGRILSEGPGMHVCAEWLQTIVPELKTTWLPVGDPYWRPV